MSVPPTIKKHRENTANPPTIKIVAPGVHREPTDTVVELSDGDIVEVPAEATPLAAARRLLFIGLPNRKIVRYGPFLKDEKGVPPLTIGRTARCNVQIDHREISRQHLEISFVNGVFVLRDMGSSGGIWYQGTRVSSLKIDDNMEIELSKAVTVAFRIRNKA